MYHGTLHGGFTVFGGRKDYWYFTKDKKYADTFEGRKANGQLYPDTKDGIEKGYYSPHRYKVYMNVKNPFITEDVDVVEDALYWDKSLAGRLRKNGYDALMLNDMSQVIVLNANQIKEVSNLTPTDDPDIRYSLRDPEAEKAAEVVRKENEKLKEDVQRLRDLLKLQRQVTGGTKFIDSSVTEAARYLKQAGGARGNTAELAKLLNTFYESFARDREISWENVREYAQTDTRLNRTVFIIFVSGSVNLRCHSADLLEAPGEVTLVGIAQGIADLPDAGTGLA